jgi:uncharacterized protein YegP (UPF0339 family)
MIGYEFKQGEDGLWYASLVSLGNHEQIWRTGDGYSDRRDAENAVELLKKAGLDAVPVEADPTLTREAVEGDDDDVTRDSAGNPAE